MFIVWISGFILLAGILVVLGWGVLRNLRVTDSKMSGGQIFVKGSRTNQLAQVFVGVVLMLWLSYGIFLVGVASIGRVFKGT